MSSDIRLINLETGGNQAYIFATNKLQNVVGASELLYRVGTRYVERAIEEVTGRKFSVSGLCEETPIEDTQGEAIEVVIATSGKALLLARGEALAQRFVQVWSRMVVEEASGLDAVAVYSKTVVDPSRPLSDQSETSFMQAFRETSRQMTLLRARGASSPLARFQRLPVVAECTYSGLPAVTLEKFDKNVFPVSASAWAQRKASRDVAFRARMEGLFPEGWSDELFKDKGLESLESQDWLAVVHADGNGLGQLFIDFEKWVRKLCEGEATGWNYVVRYRKFSAALDTISREVFRDTVGKLWGEASPKRLPIVPVVVGGDDLTAVMDGYKAIEFARCFMEAFCKKTKEVDAVREILEQTENPTLPRLGMCAGISITKPHFPFSQSYHMAEDLMKNAKQVKNQYGKDSIALDFHILYDSVATSVSDIRSRLTVREDAKNERCLTAKPYVVSHTTSDKADKKDSTQESSADPEGTEGSEKEAWRRVHDFAAFQRAVSALSPSAETQGNAGSKKLPLPSSQAHAVRESLFSEHRETQEAEWAFLMSAYGDFAAKWREVSEGSPPPGSLYVSLENADREGIRRHYTFFLDALEAVKFAASESNDEGNTRENGENGGRTA